MPGRMNARHGLVAVLLLVLSACARGSAQEAPVPTAPLAAQPTSPPATPAVALPQPSATPVRLPAAAAPSPAPSRPQPSATPVPAATVSPQPSATPLPAAAGAVCIPNGAALPEPPAAPTAEPAAGPGRTAAAAPVSSYEVVKAYPHDPRAWTEGLIFVDGALYEGTGREHGSATLSRLELETGAVLQRCELPSDFYGEGVTIFGDTIYQLTWQSHVGFVYDRASFAFRRAWSYPTEGWGLTHDGARLIMSDGTATLHFLDPETLEETGRIDAYDENGPVIRLNELEYIRGEIYANVWLTDRIARIDPATGQVLGWIDLSGLLGPEDRGQPVAELNGIAYDAERDRLFVTGKLWPKLFEIRLKP